MAHARVTWQARPQGKGVGRLGASQWKNNLGVPFKLVPVQAFWFGTNAQISNHEKMVRVKVNHRTIKAHIGFCNTVMLSLVKMDPSTHMCAATNICTLQNGVLSCDQTI